MNIAPLAEVLLWLASFPALAIIASYFVQAIKAVFPGVKDKAALVLSVVCAGAVCIGANYLLSLNVPIPAWVEQLWPTVAWVLSQLWYTFVLKKKPAAAGVSPSKEPL